MGLESPDGVAVVGHEGWFFLRTGANDNVAQFVGREVLTRGWLAAWQAMVDARRDTLRQRDLMWAALVVPDKLGVYEERYPATLSR